SCYHLLTTSYHLLSDRVLAVVPPQALSSRGHRRPRLSINQCPWSHAALASRRAAASRLDSCVRASAGDGVLARTHPAGDVLLPPSWHRGDHQRKFRRRMDRANHRTLWLWHGARFNVTRREEGDAATGAGYEDRTCRRVHPRRSAWSS